MTMAASKPERKLWQEESMMEAVAFVQNGNSLRQAARLYNVPVETLRRRVNGAVSVDCKPGPSLAGQTLPTKITRMR